MALRLAPEILDAIDVVLLVRELLRMVDPQVLESGRIEDVVPLPAIRIDDAVRDYLALYNRIQRGRRGIRNDPRVDLPTPLKDAENRYFASCTSPSLTFAMASEIALVNLDLADEHLRSFFFGLLGDDLAQTVKIMRRRLAIHPT